MRSRQRRELRVERRALRPQRLDPLVAALQVEQAPPGRVGPRQHLVDRRAVAPGQGGEVRPAALRRIEPEGVGLQVLQVAGEVRGCVGQQVPGLGDPGGERGERGIVRTLVLEQPPRLVDRADGRGRLVDLSADEGGVGAVRGRAQVLGVGEPLDLLGQCDVLAGLRLHALDLRQAEPQQLGLTGPVAGAVHQLRQLGIHPRPLRPRGPVPHERVAVVGAAEGVQRLPLVGGRAQPRLVGLAVHGHQRIGQLGKDGLRDGASTEERAGAGRRHRHRRSAPAPGCRPRRARLPRPRPGRAPRSPARGSRVPRRPPTAHRSARSPSPPCRRAAVPAQSAPSSCPRRSPR